MFLDFCNRITLYKIIDWTKDFEFELFKDSAGNIELGCGANICKSNGHLCAGHRRGKGKKSLRTLHFLS